MQRIEIEIEKKKWNTDIRWSDGKLEVKEKKTESILSFTSIRWFIVHLTIDDLTPLHVEWTTNLQNISTPILTLQALQSTQNLQLSIHHINSGNQYTCIFKIWHSSK